jgi:hypothetical protein
MKLEILIAVALALALPGLANAEQPDSGASPDRAARAVEPRADQELKKMSAFLAKLTRFALEAEESFDEVPDGQPKLQLTNVRRIAVVRPNRLASDAAGDTLNRAAWYDGQTVTVLDKEHNAYTSIKAAATIDATLDKLEDEYGVTLPLADILYSDPYAVVTEGVTYGRYLGIHQAAGVPCHHLVFSQPTIEWQIWIDASDQPLPRKLVITYVQEAGEPQYSATMRRWSLDPKFSDDLFTFEAPEGAQKIDATAMALPQDGDKPAVAPDGGGGR